MIIHAVIIGITAWVFVLILMDVDMIFGKWGIIINKLPEWLRKPLGGCEYCLAGQLSLWYFIYYSWDNYNILWHIGFVSIAIFTVKIINVIIYGLETNTD